MTNKEKAASLLDQLDIQKNALQNAIYWEYSYKDQKHIADNIVRIKDNIISLIPN